MIGLSEFWCPEEDSVTQARPRSGLHARPFSSPRQALKPPTFRAGMQKADHLAMIGFLGIWCPEEDSNLHTRRHMDLNHARLPIPPPGHIVVCLWLCPKLPTSLLREQQRKRIIGILY